MLQEGGEVWLGNRSVRCVHLHEIGKDKERSVPVSYLLNPAKQMRVDGVRSEVLVRTTRDQGSRPFFGQVEKEGVGRLRAQVFKPLETLFQTTDGAYPRVSAEAGRPVPVLEQNFGECSFFCGQTDAAVVRFVC